MRFDGGDLDVHARRLRLHEGADRRRVRAAAAAAGLHAARSRREAARVARRQVGGVRHELQRRDPRGRARRRRRALSTDGSEGNCYELDSIAWSPDSKKLAAYRVKPGYRRLVHYVESSPEDQLQPKYSTRFYAKPGDVARPRAAGPLRRRGARRRAPSTTRSSPTPTSCRASSGARTAGAHLRVQPARPPGVPGHRGRRGNRRGAGRHLARSRRPSSRYSGKKFRHDVADGREIIWMSERDGWNHLYLYRRRDRRGEEPDHEGRVGGARRLEAWTMRSGRSGSARAACIPARTRTSSTTTASTSTARA